MRLTLLIAVLFLFSLVLARQGKYGSIEDNQDRYGNDLPDGRVSASNTDECEEQCFQNSKCDSWSYDKCGHNCYLKSGNAKIRRNRCTDTGLLDRGNDHKHHNRTKGPTPTPNPTSSGDDQPTRPTKDRPTPTTKAPAPTVKPQPGCSYNNEQKWSGQSFYDQVWIQHFHVVYRHLSSIFESHYTDVQ